MKDLSKKIQGMHSYENLVEILGELGQSIYDLVELCEDESSLNTVYFITGYIDYEGSDNVKIFKSKAMRDSVCNKLIELREEYKNISLGDEEYSENMPIFDAGVAKQKEVAEKMKVACGHDVSIYDSFRSEEMELS